MRESGNLSLSLSLSSIPAPNIESINFRSSGLSSLTRLTSILFATTINGLFAKSGLIDWNNATCSVTKEREWKEMKEMKEKK
jgi:hypothetical protein